MKPRYILDPTSKKFICPNCKQKTFVQYINIETGEYLPEQYGRCDREQKCKYHILPPLETLCFFVPTDEVLEYTKSAVLIKQGELQTIVPKATIFEQISTGVYLAEYFLNDARGERKKPLNLKFIETDYKYFTNENTPLTIHKPKAKPIKEPQKIEFVPFDFETFKSTLNHYDKNLFIQNLLTKVKHPFKAADVSKAIELFRLGTIADGYRKGAICFPFIDLNGKIRTIQVKQFDSTNHTTGTDFLHSMIEKNYNRKKEPLPKWLTGYLKQPKRVSCLFGEHLLSKYPSNPVALVEAPKTAVYGTLYFGIPHNPKDFIWLAVYNKSSFSFDKLQVLRGRKVFVFPDLSKDGATFNEWQTKAQAFKSNLPNTNFIFSALLEKLASPEQKAKGLDIADVLINFDWRNFRKKHTPEKEPEPEIIKPARPEPKLKAKKKVIFKNWVQAINELESYFNNTLLPESIKLNNCSTITDPKKFIASHLSVIKSNNGNNAYLPYLERLEALKISLKTR